MVIARSSVCGVRRPLGAATAISANLTSDGVHATYPVGYALAVMSVVARTGRRVPSTALTDLDDDTVAAARLGEETIRQLSSLSATGIFVPDDPASRPALR